MWNSLLSARAWTISRIAAAGVAALLVLVAYRCYFAGPAEVPRSRLVMRNGLAYVGDARRPFSGVAFEKYPGGGRHTAIEMRHGKVDGCSRGWFENGKLEVEEYFVAGASQGMRRRWFENGQKRSEAMIEHGQLNGAYSEWHENGRCAVAMIMKEGKPDGLAESWHPSGALKFRGHLKLGTIVDQEFFPDGSTATRRAGG